MRKPKKNKMAGVNAWIERSIKSIFNGFLLKILLRSLPVYILKQLFFSISVNSGRIFIHLDFKEQLLIVTRWTLTWPQNAGNFISEDFRKEWAYCMQNKLNSPSRATNDVLLCWFHTEHKKRTVDPWLGRTAVKARLHRRFLSRQLNLIFVAPKSHQVLNMFETPAISRRQIAVKIAPGLHVRFWSCNFEPDKNYIELLRQKSPV